MEKFELIWDIEKEVFTLFTPNKKWKITEEAEFDFDIWRLEGSKWLGTGMAMSLTDAIKDIYAVDKNP